MGDDKFPFYHPFYAPPTRDLKKVKQLPLNVKFLHRFLKENGIAVRHFYNASAESMPSIGTIHNAKLHVLKLADKTLGFASIINYSLHWASTEEGWKYWNVMNNKFIEAYEGEEYKQYKEKNERKRIKRKV